MNETFEVGEVALVNKVGSRYHGHEVLIVGPLVTIARYSVETGVQHGPEPCYFIDIPGEVGPWACPPRHLRKKRPPEQKREELGEWALCPWRPTTTPVTERA